MLSLASIYLCIGVVGRHRKHDIGGRNSGICDVNDGLELGQEGCENLLRRKHRCSVTVCHLHKERVGQAKHTHTQPITL
jgi:hypothetical protein